MSSSEVNTPICYHGCHRRNLDDKRRLQIPSKWIRKSKDGKVEDTPFALILWPHEGVQDVFIQVLPPEMFQVLFQKMAAIAFADDKGQALKRRLSEKMEIASLDGSGRLMVSDGMAALAGLAVGTEAVVNGMWNCFEIWSPERYAASKPSVDAKVPEAFTKILNYQNPPATLSMPELFSKILSYGNSPTALSQQDAPPG